ncbi:cysteine desulfurase, putative [Plasmodium berghei]|uniref:cysteine desulfurase n=3 Tax=Plasmodium berghei TaxID=5821 RepID=A0A509AE96_PLABA|nr:cysteine desulfurase, putative [Plasmodium berghei ANKA]CXH89219.1 cysteine desulfurase, putative [Plasmodium berghei]VUC53987.1 cysteine desulfurase, putative [Plasmodium berghei ANKA]|eukprot:XP_034419839.1 cysteine desulfurase, putative [Plasmodium berghei ANKA]
MKVFKIAKTLNTQSNNIFSKLNKYSETACFKNKYASVVNSNENAFKKNVCYNNHKFSSRADKNEVTETADNEIKTMISKPSENLKNSTQNDNSDKLNKINTIHNDLKNNDDFEFSNKKIELIANFMSKEKEKKMNRFYLDSQATTMIDPRVLDKMMPYMTYIYGNAHSRNHFFGWESEQAVEDSRANIIKLLNGNNNKEIIFTSGATESNNLALIGTCTYYNKLNNQKNHIITSQIEHKCILQTCRYLQTKGFEVTYLKPDTNGLVKLKDFKNSIKENTILASFIYVNNEIGVIQDIENIGKICKEKNIIFHTDASQAAGKIKIDVQKMNIDLLSLSSHKLYGPKGVGALYIKRKKPNIRLNAIIHGGGQERGLRSGTLPTHLIVGLGEAANICLSEMDRDNQKMHFFFNYVKNYISKELDYIIFNGCQINRYFGNMNISFLFVEGESLLMSLNDIALSSGSACTSSTLEPSYVLRSIGITEEIAHTSIRIGFNRFTTFFEVQQLCNNLVKSVKRLRSISPLYEAELEKNTSGNYPKFIWT